MVVINRNLHQVQFRAPLSCWFPSDLRTQVFVGSLELVEQDMICVTDALRCIIDVYTLLSIYKLHHHRC